MKTLSHFLFGIALAAPLTITTAVQAENPPSSSSMNGDKQDVTMDQLLNAPKHTDQWLMYNGDFTGSRYSRLNLINKDNIRSIYPNACK